jgi:hypothetical protein
VEDDEGEGGTMPTQVGHLADGPLARKTPHPEMTSKKPGFIAVIVVAETWSLHELWTKG